MNWKRAKRVGQATVGLALAAVAVLTSLRLVSRFATSDDSPRVALSIGADLANDVGLHQASYQATLVSLGARVVEVTPRGERSAQSILDAVDALVLTGGGDVDPTLYGGAVGAATLVDSKRDAFEAALIREALERDLPVLMVCRGHQLLNVVFGGSLTDLRTADRERAKIHGISAKSLVAHSVSFTDGSLLREIAGQPTAEVNSFHGQAVARLGRGLAATAVSPDGVVEGIEVPNKRFAVSVQWHPELIAFSDPAARRLFQRLLDEAHAYRARR